MANRILYIGLLKTFAIFLVIWGHAIMHFQPDFENSVCFNVIYAFHMPLFMMLSGYFAASSMKLGAVEFISKKFRQLLLPCLSWGILCWITISSGLIEGRFNLELKELFTGWLGLIDNFWFLKSCFICYMLAWVCKKAGKYQYVAFFFAWLLCSMQGRFNLNMMFPSFVFGMLLRENTTIDQGLYKFRWLIATLFLGMLVYSIYYGDSPYFLKLLLGLSGAFTCFTLFREGENMLISQRVPSIFIKVGEKTLGIYVLQAITLEYLLPRYFQIDCLPIMAIATILPICSLILVFIYYGMCDIISKSRLLAFLMFGVKYK